MEFKDERIRQILLIRGDDTDWREDLERLERV